MQENQKLQSRKKFLLFGAAAFSSVTVLRFFGRTKKKKPETIKMLAQDGTLVEIDKEHMASIKKKITDSELQHWIKTNQEQ
jgi:nicotinamide mononucleotide adenylyltransferase